jgi:hypothetical protein
VSNRMGRLRHPVETALIEEAQIVWSQQIAG